MRVLFLVPYPAEGASNRYRVEQYLPYLEKEGIRYSLRPFWNRAAYRALYKNGHYFRKIFFFIRGTISRVLQIFCIAGYDVVFIHREAYPIGGAFFETVISVLKKPIIFDFDDAIFLPASSRPNNFIERFKDPRKVISIIRRSEYVICGNSFLAAFASRYNVSVAVIPTPIDTGKYYPAARNPGRKIVIGWIGSATTLDFLSPMKNVISVLSKEFPGIIFKVVGGDFSFEGLSNVVSKPWSLNEEIDDLRQFDIGIMPMPDNDWTRGKCGFKAILYMSMGIPCVCSPVGVNNEIISDGINGFLADSEEEWIQKLSSLIRDCRLREKIGLAGRKTVEDKYSLKVNAPKYLEIIRKVNDKCAGSAGS